jgi:hypothetical protein
MKLFLSAATVSAIFLPLAFRIITTIVATIIVVTTIVVTTIVVTTIVATTGNYTLFHVIMWLIGIEPVHRLWHMPKVFPGAIQNREQETDLFTHFALCHIETGTMIGLVEILLQVHQDKIELGFSAIKAAILMRFVYPTGSGFSF